MIVIGSVISLAYYLRVVAVMWMGTYEVELPDLPAPPRQAGHRLVARGRRAAPSPRWPLVAVLFAAATLFFGIWPDPLFDLARDVGTSLSNLR